MLSRLQHHLSPYPLGQFLSNHVVFNCIDTSVLIRFEFMEHRGVILHILAIYYLLFVCGYLYPYVHVFFSLNYLYVSLLL